MRIYKYFAISIIPQWLLLQWIKRNPEIVDQFYSQGVFVWLSKLTLQATAWIPFSVGDLFYAIAIAYILKSIWHFKRLLRWSTLIKILGCFGFLLFLFHLQWGLHYHQTSLSSRLNAPSDYSSEKLELFTHHLIEQTNQFHKKLSQTILSLLKSRTQQTKFLMLQQRLFEINIITQSRISKNRYSASP